MEVVIFIGLVVVGLVIFYNWNKKDVPTDVVKTEQDDAAKAPYKVETTDMEQRVWAESMAKMATGDAAMGASIAFAQTVTPAPAPAPEPAAEPAKKAKKPAAKKAPAKKTAAKKTAGAKKSAAKKKSA